MVRKLIFILVLVSLAAACGPTAPPLPDPKADPRAALLYSAQPDLVHSMGFTSAMSITLHAADDASAAALGDKGPAILSANSGTASAKGVLEVTDQTSGRVNFQMLLRTAFGGSLQNTETILLDDRVWARLGGGGWTEIDAKRLKGAEAIQQMASGMRYSAEMEEAYRSAIDVEYVGKEARDGQSLHHLRFALDPQTANAGGALGSAGAQAEQLAPFIKDGSIVYDAWLGADDLILRYLDTKMSFDLSGDLVGVKDANLRALADTTLAYTDINEPVTIEAPVTE